MVINARLREITERAFTQTSQNEIDSDLLIAAIEDDALRAALQRAREKATQGRFETLEGNLRGLQIKLHKHQQLAERQAARKRARESKVPRGPA